MAAVVADTHAILWYLTKPEKLPRKALGALRRASRSGEMIYVSAITLVEAIYLAEKEKIKPSAVELLEKALSDENVALVAVPVDFPVVQEIRRIPRDVVPDMPDRIIAATALHLDLPLVTSDRRIRQAEVETIW